MAILLLGIVACSPPPDELSHAADGAAGDAPPADAAATDAHVVDAQTSDASSPPHDADSPDANTPDASSPADAALPDGGSAGCRADHECATGACHEAAGTCVAEARVLFVATNGDDTGTCLRATPCATIARAVALLSASRDTIAIAAGAYAGTFSLGVQALISGPSTYASEVYLSSPTHATTIAKLTGTIVFVEGVSLGGNTSTATTSAIVIKSGAKMVADRLIVRDNVGNGIYLQGGSLDATRLELVANGYGVLADETSNARVERSYAHDNQSALSFAGSYHVTNTIFSKNAKAIGVFGAANTGTLDFNTFAFHSKAVITAAHSITATNSIFADNALPPSTPVAVRYSLFTGTAMAGVGNLSGDPSFVDAAGGDFHLGPTSAAVDKADPTTSIAVDFDGDQRPSGAGRDIGADER